MLEGARGGRGGGTGGRIGRRGPAELSRCCVRILISTILFLPAQPAQTAQTAELARPASPAADKAAPAEGGHETESQTHPPQRAGNPRQQRSKASTGDADSPDRQATRPPASDMVMMSKSDTGALNTLEWPKMPASPRPRIAAVNYGFRALAWHEVVRFSPAASSRL